MYHILRLQTLNSYTNFTTIKLEAKKKEKKKETLTNLTELKGALEVILES